MDDSIVVIENIHRHLEMGEDRRRAASTALREIMLPAASIALVIAIVMVPLVFMGSTVGNALAQFAVVVIASPLFSLAISFTLTPMLASRFAVLEHLSGRTFISRFAIWFERQYQNVAENYSRVLAWALRHRKTVLLASGSLLLSAIAMIPLGIEGTELVSTTDHANFSMPIETTPAPK